MQREFDVRGAAQGGVGTMFVAGFVMAGLIVLFDLGESRVAWGLFLILLGVSFGLGMRWFGLRTVSRGAERESDT